jgi:hypothetical protein
MGVCGRRRASAVKIQFSLIKCGRCGKRYSNPLTHTCIVRMDRRTPVRSSSVGPKLQVKCGRCGKPLGNPLTHTCHVKTDFKRRKREHERRQKAASRPAATGNKHDYTACTDPDCHLYVCRIYKEGFSDGVASCPLPHGM